MLSIIVAIDENQGIGLNGWMPWDIPEDLRLFKQRTLGSPLIMGFTTFSGLPQPLKGRHTYVIYDQQLENLENVTYITNLDEFTDKVKDIEQEFFVCGGASIYRQLLPHCKKMYISHVEGVFPADTFFPAFSDDEFIVLQTTKYSGFTLIEYQRRY